MDPIPVILVLSLILVVLVLELAVYFIPFRVRMRAERIESAFFATGSIYWLIVGLRFRLSEGLSTIQVCIGETAILSRPLEMPVTGIYPGKGTGGEKTAAPDVSAFIFSLPSLIPQLLRLLRTVSRSISFRKLDCHTEIGLSGPAETGMFYGAYWAVRPLLCLDGRVNLEVKPQFSREVYEGCIEAEFRISRPFDIFTRALQFALQPEIRHFLKSGGKVNAR